MSSPQPIRQNSTDDISIGPAVELDGFTLNTAITLGSVDSAAVKLGDDSVVDISGYTMAATTNMDGEYDLTLQTGISDTVGPFTLLIEDVSLILPIREKFFVYDPVVFDALYASSPTLLTARDIGQVYESTVGTVNSQDQPSFDMDTAIITDDNWIGLICTVQDITNGETVVRWIADVDQTNDRLILDDNGPLVFGDVAVGDIIRIETRVHPTFALQAYDPPTRTEATSDKTSSDDLVVAMAQLMGRKDANLTTDRAAAIALLNADEGSGVGAYSHLTDSQQAIKDILPAAASATRAEATTDKDQILSKLPNSLSIGGRMFVAVEVVNGRLIVGTGKVPTGTEWGDGGPEV